MKNLLNTLAFILLFICGAQSAQINITNCYDLLAILPNTASNITLQNNIDCSGNLIAPIGDNVNQFFGILDGNGFSISNYSLVASYNYSGLFAYGQNAKVKNLTLINFNIQTDAGYVGALFGQCDNCLIQDVVLNTSSPSITKSNSTTNSDGNVGGLVGRVNTGTMTNCLVQNTRVEAPLVDNVGGLVGSAYIFTEINCHNLGFPSNSSTIMVNGKSNVGGLVGNIELPGTNFMDRSGVSNGVISAKQGINSANIGGLAGIGNTVRLTECYVKSSVKIDSDGNQVGGMFGFYQNTFTVQFDNFYIRANVSGTDNVGGLVGSMLINNANSFQNFSQGYVSSPILALGTNGSSFVGLKDGNLCSFDQVYYDTSLTTLSALQSNCSDNSAPQPKTCSDLSSTISASFNGSIWSGANLVSEVPFTPDTLCPTTNAPSTTNAPTTIIPSSTGEVATIPDTLAPTTSAPSTSTPSSAPSTTSSTTLTPVVCLYNVPNCEKCGADGPIFDQSQFNISCTQDGDKWTYTFVNKFSNTTTITQPFTMNGNTNMLIVGDVKIASNVTIDFVISFNANKRVTATSANIKSTGCLTIEGNVNLVVNQRPQNGNVSVVLATYNCSQSPAVNDNQFVVKATYKESKCDKIERKSNSQQNSLSVTVSSTQNANCKGGISTGAIIGIVVGVVGGTLLVIVIGVIIIWRRDKKYDKEMSVNMEDMKEDKKWKNNDNHQEKTRWSEFKN